MTKMKWLLAIVAGLVAGLFVAAYYRGPLVGTETGQKVLQTAANATAPTPPVGVITANVGDKVPNISLKDWNGQQKSLTSLIDGKRTLVNFWATWCGPCIKEIPELVAFTHTSSAKSMQIAGIAMDEPEAAKAFASLNGMEYPNLIDSPGPRDSSVQMGDLRGVLPYSVLIGDDGRIIKTKLGPFAPGEIAQWVAP